jgi:hypothetical protein
VRKKRKINFEVFFLISISQRLRMLGPEKMMRLVNFSSPRRPEIGSSRVANGAVSKPNRKKGTRQRRGLFKAHALSDGTDSEIHVVKKRAIWNGHCSTVAQQPTSRSTSDRASIFERGP